MFLELNKLGVADIFREHLAGWSKKAGQRNRVETVATTHVCCRVSRPEVEGCDHAPLHLSSPIFLRLRLRSLARRTTDDQQQQNRGSQEGVERRSSSVCAKRT